MVRKVFDYRLLALFFALIGIYFIMEYSVHKMKEDRYGKVSQTYISQLKTLIKEKQNTTNILALSIANNQLLKDALLKNDHKIIDIEYYSKQLRENSDFKNVWFQVVDSKGNSFKRSWVKKRGDSLLDIRVDINMMLKKPRIMSGISTGKFDMTFKSMVPVMQNNRLIGIFEVITHFNSISKKLDEQGIDAAFLVDSSYKKQLTKAFTKIFVKDYYVANKDVKPYYLNYLNKKDIDEFLKFEKKFKVDEKSKKLIVLYELPDKLGREMGHLLLFKDLKEIKMPVISTIRQIFVFSAIILILFALMFNLYMINKKNAKTIQKNHEDLLSLNEQNLIKIKELESQKDKTNKIFNAQPNITIITDGKSIHDANSSFLSFFNSYSSLTEFTKDHDCICDFFVKYEGENYIFEKVIDGVSWIDYILNNNQVTFKVMMEKNKKEYHFIVDANRSSHIEENGKYLIVVSFLDITDEVKLQRDLREKEKILMQQSKLASMGEMIGNIAHQWRQPLSVISTSASLLSLKDEYDELEDEDMEKYLESILRNTEYLSKTIDDFRDYFKPEKKEKEFFISDTIQKSLFLISSKFKTHEIEIIQNIEQCRVKGFENEFIQVIMNLLNNAKDALLENNSEEKVIMIDCSCDKNKVYLNIKDNGGGIPEDIMDRIFEPYFSTKHQSQGTGVGLFMSEEMISKHMSGEIDVKNEEFEYKGKSYMGANFSIVFPAA